MSVCCSGWILIDRCGKHFSTILNFLRDGSVPLPETRRELLELQKEAKYYLIEELVCTIEAQLVSQTQVDPICKVPLITSQKEEQALVGSTAKVSPIHLLLKICLTVSTLTLPSDRHHLSCDDCLEDKSEDYQNCSVLYCGPQLYIVISTTTTTPTYEVLSTQQHLVG